MFRPDLTFTLLLTALFCLQPERTQAQQPPVPVVVAPVTHSMLAARQSFVATVEPTRRVLLSAETSNRLVEVTVQRGQRVESGQVIARLRDRDATLRLAAASAEEQRLEQELEELVTGARPEEVVAARARLASAVADEEYRGYLHEQAKVLFESSSASEERVRETSSAYQRAVALRRATEAELALVVEGPRKERVAAARAALAGQKNLRSQIEDEVARHVVQAPFAGWVVARLVDEGTWLSPGAGIVEIAELDQVELELSVPEDRTSHLRPGGLATITLVAAPGELFKGTISSVIPKADPRSRALPVRVRLENPIVDGMPRFAAGMSALVDIALEPETLRLVVPKDALVLGGATIVYAVHGAPEEGQHVVHPVPVRVLRTDGDHAIVEGELEPGVRVVVRGNERLRPGQSVAVTGTIDGAK